MGYEKSCCVGFGAPEKRRTHSIQHHTEKHTAHNIRCVQFVVCHFGVGSKCKVEISIIFIYTPLPYYCKNLPGSSAIISPESSSSESNCLWIGSIFLTRLLSRLNILDEFLQHCSPGGFLWTQFGLSDSVRFLFQCLNSIVISISRCISAYFRMKTQHKSYRCCFAIYL